MMLRRLLVGVALFIPMTIADVLPECKGKVLDLYYVVDKSASISDQEITIEREAVKGMIQGFDIGPAKTRVGLVSFSSDVEHIFSLGQHNTHASYDDVNVVPRPTRKVGTLTHLGLHEVCQRFAVEGRTGVPQIIVVITDGKSTAPGSLLVTTTKIHTTTDVKVVAIGVGRDADLQELDLIASGSDGDNVYLVKSYENLNLEKENITRAVCNSLQIPQDRATCPSICLEHGSVRGGTKAGETVTFACDGGYSLNSVTSSMTCGQDGSWPADAPVCIKDCDHKYDIPFGSMTYTTSKLNGMGGKAEYSCIEGYQLRGYKDLRCMTNGRWDEPNPKCIKATCKPFTRLNRGSITHQDTKIGGTATFTCDVGYTLQGAATLTCGADRRWDAKVPTCVKVKRCFSKRYFPGGRTSHVGPVDANKSLSFSCLPGYTLEGASTVYCSNNGKWQGSFPICKKTRCRWIPLIKNGKIERTGSDNGDTMDFSCYDGFSLDGASKLTCVNREWDNKIPSCRASEKCPPIRYFRHGRVENYSRLVGSTISFACNKGWDLSTESTQRTCNNDGQWSSEIPYCVRNEAVTDIVVKCPHIVDIINGRCTGSHDPYSIVSCSCNPGYQVTGHRRLKCRRGGRWNVQFSADDYPKCSYVGCKNLPLLSNGESEYREGRGGATVVFTCNDGFRLIGSKISKCINNEWTEGVPKCKETRCPNLLRISNGQTYNTSSGDTEGSLRQFECDPGFKLVGPRRVNCRARKWMPYIPRCVYIPQCKAQQGIRDGTIEGSEFKVGARLKVTCNPGYVPSDPRSMKCLPNRQWSHQVKCQLKLCPQIGHVENGRALNYTNMAGTKVEIVCNEGFSRRGNGFLECRQNGTWSSNPPSCTETKPMCSALCLPQGQVVYEGRQEGQWARFRCDDGYNLLGPAVVECQADGRWSDYPPTCESEIPKECTGQPMDLFFIVDVSNPKSIGKLGDTMKSIATHFKTADSTTRLGVITYDSLARIEVDLKDYPDITSFILADLLSREPRGTDKLLYKALDILPSAYVYKGDRKLAAIIITENRVHRTDLVSPSVAKLSSIGVALFTVGIGERVQPDKLKLIASGSGSTNVFLHARHEELYEGTNARQIAQAVCKYQEDEQVETLSEKPIVGCVNKQLDVYFVVDTSKSIGAKEFEKEEETVRFIINNFDIAQNRTRVGLITYNRYVFQDFPLSQYGSREEINSLTHVLKRSPPGQLRAGTRTDLALQQMLDNFKTESSGRKRICILITDGRATAPVKTVADALDNTNIKRIAIGVGRNADLDELNLLATGSNGKYVMAVRNFDDLRKLNILVAADACE